MRKLNPYFSQERETLNPNFSYNGENFNNDNERYLLKSLVTEKIQQFGIKTHYMQRSKVVNDEIFGEAPINHFSTGVDIEMDMENPDGLNELTAMAQFGYNVASTITLQCVCDRIIEKLNGDYPMVGDLIWVPLLGAKGVLLEIKYIDDRMPSFVAGTWMLYTFRCQMFDLGSETFETGIEELDALNDIDELLKNDEFSDNTTIQTEADTKIIEEPNAWPTLLRRG